MNKKIYTALVLGALCISSYSATAQKTATNQSRICGNSEAMQAYYNEHPEAIQETQELEQFTQNFVNDRAAAKTTASKYIIPVVFHIYGTTQGGYTIDDALIKKAVEGLNEDFHGRNADYATVHNQFMSLRDTLDIEFRLARKDPNGNPTTGTVYHSTKKGYGQANVLDNAIAADAWDNYKYMNIYIMEDLYDDGVTNNSGVAWYPNKSMSDKNIARIVYNGRYLATNNQSNPQFASVLTHECGHFFNLIHTFEGGCKAPNDNVADTPPCTVAQGCHTSQTGTTPLNCNSNLLNAENYMDYNDRCYKMFTKGQVQRMTAALNHSTRFPLWQASNLTTTGVVGINNLEQTLPVYNIFPNPSNGTFSFTSKANNKTTYDVTITNLVGRTIYAGQHTVQKGSQIVDMDISSQPTGIYLLHISTDEARKTFKVQIK